MANKKYNSKHSKRSFKGNARRHNQSRAKHSREVDTARDLTPLRIGDELVTPTPPPGVTYEWRLKEIRGLPADAWNQTILQGWEPVKEADLPSSADHLKMSHLRVGDFYQRDGMVLCQMSTRRKLRIDLGNAEHAFEVRKAVNQTLKETFTDEVEGDLVADLEKFPENPGKLQKEVSKIEERNFNAYKRNVQKEMQALPN